MGDRRLNSFSFIATTRQEIINVIKLFENNKKKISQNNNCERSGAKRSELARELYLM